MTRDEVMRAVKGLNDAQRSALEGSMILHPDLTPIEAIGYIPKSRAELSKALSVLGAKNEKEFSARYCPDDALMSSWLQIRGAVLSLYAPEPEPEIPF